MRSECTNQNLQHEQQRSKFLPMLCSSSTKQVIKLSHRRSSSTSSSSSSTVSDDPLSPRVGCMGQVKRNNKVVGFPPITTSITCTMKSDQICNNNNSIVKYHKLKRFFSTKSSPTTTLATAAAAKSGAHKGKIICAGRISSNSGGVKNNTICRGIRPNIVREDYHHGNIILCRPKNEENNCGYNKVNLVELDPPLPVVKQPQQENENGENVSLWTRRSGGAPLRTLQLQITQQTSTLLLQPTTV